MIPRDKRPFDPAPNFARPLRLVDTGISLGEPGSLSPDIQALESEPVYHRHAKTAAAAVLAIALLAGYEWQKKRDN